MKNKVINFFRFIKLVFSLRLRFERKTLAIFGKVISLRYILDISNPYLDLDQISNILYLNSADYLKKDDILNQEKIYSTVHKFLLSVSVKKTKILYITYNENIKKYDVLINTTFFKAA